MKITFSMAFKRLSCHRIKKCRGREAEVGGKERMGQGGREGGRATGRPTDTERRASPVFHLRTHSLAVSYRALTTPSVYGGRSARPPPPGPRYLARAPWLLGKALAIIQALISTHTISFKPSQPLASRCYHDFTN